MAQSLPTLFAALLTSSCTLGLAITPVLIADAGKTYSATDPAASLSLEQNGVVDNPNSSDTIFMAGGALLGLVAGGSALAFLESRRHQHKSRQLKKQLDALESSLHDKNEKLVELTLQSVAQESALAQEAFATDREVLSHPIDPTASSTPAAEQSPNATHRLEDLLAWTTSDIPTELSPAPEEQLITEAVVAAQVEMAALPPDPPAGKSIDHAPPTHSSVGIPTPPEFSPVMPLPPRVSPPPLPPQDSQTNQLQLRLMLQMTQIQELETTLQAAQQRETSLQVQLQASHDQTADLREQVRIQAERLMAMEAYEVQVQQQHQQLRQLHAALHNMRQQVAQKTSLEALVQQQEQQLEQAHMAMQTYQATVQQNQQLQAALSQLRANAPTSEEMEKIYTLVQRQRERIQELDHTVKTLKARMAMSFDDVITSKNNPIPSLSAGHSAPVYTPLWRDLLQE